MALESFLDEIGLGWFNDACNSGLGSADADFHRGRLLGDLAGLGALVSGGEH